VSGWPEPYNYTVYDRIFGDFPAENTVFTPYIYIYIIYIYISGQPYKCETTLHTYRLFLLGLSIVLVHAPNRFGNDLRMLSHPLYLQTLPSRHANCADEGAF